MKIVWVIVLIILTIVAVVVYTTQKSPDLTIKTNNNTIYILNFSFAPETITIKKDSEVKWINQDTSIHQIKFDDSIVSQPMGIGESFLYIFNQTGEYGYTCAIHPSMKGKIMVE